MGNQLIRVLVVDDHVMIRRGLVAFLKTYMNIQVDGEADNGKTAISLADQLKPDVILMDLSMPGIDGVETTQRIVAKNPAARILILTGFGQEENFLRAMKAGALGFLEKTVEGEDIIQAIHTVYDGEPIFDLKYPVNLLFDAKVDKGTARRKHAVLFMRETVYGW
jgi:two-component system, NarL family, response regulator LiaR